ncbi:MAG: geopeptide radical SAM maturase [Thermodesulfobacteriota bacterium]|nr:geopeptide radical SAM maturase [Thermodesulfobacteriota bacterium]
MELSHYCKVYPDEERPGCFVLFSTKKASKTLVYKETLQSIKEGTLSPSDEAILSRLGMIVSDRKQERQSILSLFDEVNRENHGLHITTVLNLDCNFACIYCYEGQIKGKRYMTDQIGDRLVGFIKEQFTKDKAYLLVDFYGGEPLLSIGLIKSIAKRLKSFVQERGATFIFTLVTNGSLFTREVAEDLVALGLESVKITLDGPAEIHNRYRPFKSGRESFETIIRNIKQTCDIVDIGIGGNFDRDNFKRFVQLLDYLSMEGLTPDRISAVKFDPVMDNQEGDTLPVDYRGGCMSINEPWISEASVFLREEILKRGYNTPKPAPILCMVEKMNAYVVNLDGLIYKCPAFIGKEGFAIGNIQSGITDYSSSLRLGIWKNEECLDCVYLPLCFGGCRYMTFLREGNIDKLDCQKAYLDASLEAMVKQDTKYRAKA